MGRLSATGVKHGTQPGRLGDGDGLFLIVGAKGGGRDRDHQSRIDYTRSRGESEQGSPYCSQRAGELIPDPAARSRKSTSRGIERFEDALADEGSQRLDIRHIIQSMNSSVTVGTEHCEIHGRIERDFFPV